MAEQIAVIDVIVPSPTVVDVAALGVQGPPGEPGADGAPGPAGPQGPAGPAGVAGPHNSTHYVGGADALAGSLAATDVRVGTNPAQSGAVRLPVDATITARNYSNTADQNLLRTNGLGSITIGESDTVFGDKFQAYTAIAVGLSNPAQSGAVRLANNQEIKARSGNNDADMTIALVNTGNQVEIGGGSLVKTVGFAWHVGPVRVDQQIELQETTAPAAPAANAANLFLKDNGSGKTQLMVQFATGAAIQLAIQP